MKTITKTIKTTSRQEREDRAYSIVSVSSILAIILTILSLSYVIDNASRFNSLQLFTFIIISLYFVSQAGSLWVFSKFKNIKMMKSIFFKVTGLTITSIGLLTVFQMFGHLYESGLIGIFFLLAGVAVPLVIGRLVWNQAKSTDSTYIIRKVTGTEKKQIDNRAEFMKAQQYKEEFDY